MLLQIDCVRPLPLSPALSLSLSLLGHLASRSKKTANFSFKSTEAAEANVIARLGNGHHEKLEN